MTIQFTYECKKPARFPPTYLLDIAHLSLVMQACQLVMDEAIARPSKESFLAWFGDFGLNQDSKFRQCCLHVAAMRNHASNHPFVLVQSSAITLAMTDQSKPELEISLGTYTSLGIYTLGEMVVTFLHELSHKTPGLMTKDIVIGTTPSTSLGPGSPISAYKEEAIKLAEEKPASAFQNAENWGYYLASYHEAAELADLGSWDYTKNKKDITNKVVGSPKPTKGAHWAGPKWVKHEGRGCVPDPDGLPIIRFKVNGNYTTYDRASTHLPGVDARDSAGPSGVVHVKKAVSDTGGPHKCDKCNLGFLSLMKKKIHAAECTG